MPGFAAGTSPLMRRANLPNESVPNLECAIWQMDTMEIPSRERLLRSPFSFPDVPTGKESARVWPFDVDALTLTS